MLHDPIRLLNCNRRLLTKQTTHVSGSTFLFENDKSRILTWLATDDECYCGAAEAGEVGLGDILWWNTIIRISAYKQIL